MTTADFRRLASLFLKPQRALTWIIRIFVCAERSFATLGHPAQSWGMVKLTPEQQHYFSKEHPEIFVPVKGAWGRRGATSVRLRNVDKATLQKAISAAWRNTAPKRLLEQFAELG
jgi:hypothetical protein